MSSSAHFTAIVHTLRLVLRGSSELGSSFRDVLYTPIRAKAPRLRIGAYTNTEISMIRREARKIIRATVVRIRASRATAAAYLASHGTPLCNDVPAQEDLRAFLLAHVVAHGTLPRKPTGGLKVPGSGSLVAELNPNQAEVWALAVLLMCLTGLNMSTIVDLTTEHVMASASGEAPVALLRGIKARRGPLHSELDLTLMGKAGQSNNDDLGTPYGVYQIALELGQEMRRHTQDDSLFMFYCHPRKRETTSGFGFRPLKYHWSNAKTRLGNDQKCPLSVDTRRIRRWFLDRHQRPVAQSVHALASIYLAKDPSTVSEYQGVVEKALEGEFSRIRIENLRRVLTAGDWAEAAHDPGTVAKRFGIDVETLSRLLSGELDTVTGACIDNSRSPYSPPGRPCTASFLLCLGCPCSRSEPRHLPVQALTLVALRNLRPNTEDSEWQRKFSVATARLEDLMELQRADPNAEAARASEEDAQMVRALVEGDLDL